MAARPIWKGAISFGLVHVPVTLFSLEQKFDLHFRMLDSRTKSTIRYERVNEETGEEVPWDKIVKGYEYQKGNYVILTEEDFKNASPEASQTIDIQNFVAKDEISDIYFDKPYVLVPQRKAEKGYVLLREVLSKSGRVGIAKVVIRTREYLSAVVPMEDCLVLVLLRFAQEIRPFKEFDVPREALSHYKVTDREIELAEQLVEAQTAKWEPEKYHDEYRDQLMKWIDAKAEKGEAVRVEEGEEEAADTQVLDLAELLRKSISGKEPKAKSKRKSKSSKSA